MSDEQEKRLNLYVQIAGFILAVLIPILGYFFTEIKNIEYRLATIEKELKAEEVRSREIIEDYKRFKDVVKQHVLDRGLH